MTYPTSTKPPTIRDLMPDGYLATLSERTGVKTITNLSQLVLREHTGSIHWPQVEKLAQETNPEGFARWQIAQAGGQLGIAGKDIEAFTESVGAAVQATVAGERFP